MKITPEEQNTIERLRRLRQNQTVSFDIVGAYIKDLANLKKNTNSNIMNLPKDFFRKQIKARDDHTLTKGLLMHLINEIFDNNDAEGADLAVDYSDRSSCNSSSSSIRPNNLRSF
ncbi:MAG: hypothetical protein SFT68_00410 [Rickettsiaceae bacterium]|nr:hypothetical protein [Rickettsiaceae bacterium]